VRGEHEGIHPQLRPQHPIQRQNHPVETNPCRHWAAFTHSASLIIRWGWCLFYAKRKEKMKTSVERLSVADLKSVLPGLSKIVSRKSSLPVLGCVKVIHAPDHTIRLHADNLEEAVTVRLQNPSQGMPGELLVPLEELAIIAKRCSAEDTIELSVDGKETSITYPAAGTLIKKPLKHVGLEEFPPGTEVNTEPVQLDNAFKEALQQAFDCASEDSSRHVLHGACLDVSKKEAHYVVGTDGRHLFTANSFLFDIPESVIVPRGKFLTWPGFTEDGPWTLRFQRETKPATAPKTYVSPTWVRLDSDHWTYVSKPIEGPFPNWKQAVPPTEALKSHIYLGEAGIKIILDALPLLPGLDDRDQPVTLEIKGEYLKLKAKGKDDWTEIPIPATVSGLPVTISMNRTYLAKALKFGCTQIDIEDKTSPMMFSTKGKMLVVCPLAPDAKTVPAVPAAPAAPATPPTSPPENASAAATPPPAEPAAPAAESPASTQPVVENNGAATATRGALNSQPTASEETPAIDLMLAQIGTVRDGVKKALDDVTNLERLLRRAVKEQRANEKEINRARSTLRSLKSVEL
jgi:DNA polymerase III sliding clamp (beta) subunit (PCNA family)